MISKNLHIGTSGWSYMHWSGVFYPEDLKPDKYLEYYITKFDCVELNSSFYHLPLKSTVSGWMNRTSDTFRFCPKMSRFITHQLQLSNAEEPLIRFIDVFAAMKARLGPALIQIHPGLLYDRALITAFFNLLQEKYSEYRFAIEIRNKSWINDDFLQLLSIYRVAFVIADSGRRYPYHEAVTTGFIYLRFHGREQLYATDYSENDLRQYAEKISGWLYDGKEVWAFFNNDFHGYAVKNALRLMEMLNTE
ncbi:MAG: DUF72 domain-containing protein [Bacteroidota bacterium]|nr:DUF72 domain-containing protein [Bacteroidota bacterium]